MQQKFFHFLPKSLYFLPVLVKNEESRFLKLNKFSNIKNIRLT